MVSSADHALDIGAARLQFGFELFQPDAGLGEDYASSKPCLRGDHSRVPNRGGSHSQSEIERDSLIAAVFEHLPCAVPIVDANRNVIAANQIGEKLLAGETSGLRARSRQLETTTRGQAAMLLSDARKRTTFSLSISVLASSSPIRIGAGRAGILMQAISLDLPSSFSDRLQSPFGLSAKGTRLATMLAEACALKEAAGLLGVRFATARSYLENIF